MCVVHSLTEWIMIQYFKIIQYNDRTSKFKQPQRRNERIIVDGPLKDKKEK